VIWRHRLAQFCLVTLASIGTALLAAWHVTDFVWAREQALVPFGLISIAPEALKGLIFMSPVAIPTAAIVSAVAATTWFASGVRGIWRAAAGGGCGGLFCAAGVMLLPYIPHPFDDSIPGYQPRAWLMIAAATALGSAAGVVVTGGHSKLGRAGTSRLA
jgi:hypothetical protein